MLIGHIINALEKAVPQALQESYDNTGLIIGNSNDECTGVLITVDVTEATVQEAITSGCNLIIAHHPLIFKGFKRLTPSTPEQRAAIEAVKNGISVYACHTSLDSVAGGVSQRMAAMLNLRQVQPLAQERAKLLKLQTYVPTSHADDLRLALFDAGAGEMGNYRYCSYNLEGRGTFQPIGDADPYVGTIGETHTEQEECIQVLLPTWLKRKVEQALLQAHPYEHPAYEFIAIEHPMSMTGLGAIGNFDQAIPVRELAELIKQTFSSPIVRTNARQLDVPVRRMALCGGSGSSLIPDAIAAHAQVLLTSDVKYHDFLSAYPDLIIMDIGHHESENCSKTIIFDIISEKFPNFAVRYSTTDANPIKYL